MSFCALSGELPQVPVISTKSGLLYERRLIEKYIATNGTEPETDEKLEASDLISLKAGPNTVIPRPAAMASIPSLLHALQDEWDALMLETFTLKQQYISIRQQLSHALYSQDAATRVIARLIKERDAAREALSDVQSTIGLTTIGNFQIDKDVPMNVEGQAVETTEGIFPKHIMAEIDGTLQTLSAMRKKRKQTTDYTSVSQVKNIVLKQTITSLHSAKPAGITSLAVSTLAVDRFVTGGNDKIVQLYDRSADKVITSLKGHSKKINQVVFREKDLGKTLILSASADKTARIWTEDDVSGDFTSQHVVKLHTGEITGLCIHPSSTLLCLASMDKTYSIHDLRSFKSVFHSSGGDDPYTAVSIHPDGALLSLGTSSSKIHVYDIRSGAIAATLSLEDNRIFSINSLSFSENGYHLLAPDSLTSAGIWDLRKLSRAHSIMLGHNFTVNRVVYDVGAQYFGIAGSSGARIFAHKSWEELLSFEDGLNIPAIVFGPDGKEVWSIVGRDVKIWGTPE